MSFLTLSGREKSLALTFCESHPSANMIWRFVIQGCPTLNVKVLLHLLNMQFVFKLHYTSVMTQISSRIAALEPCIKAKVHCYQARSISYNLISASRLLISTATLSYKSL